MTDEEVQLREAELAGACITQDGKLQPHFEYILGMREAKERDLRTMEEQERDILFSAVEGTELSPRLRQQLEGSTVLNVQGHLFDSGLINQVGGLEIIDRSVCMALALHTRHSLRICSLRI